MHSLATQRFRAKLCELGADALRGGGRRRILGCLREPLLELRMSRLPRDGGDAKLLERCIARRELGFERSHVSCFLRRLRT